MELCEVDHLNVDLVWWLYPSIEVGASLLYGSSARARCNKPFMYGPTYSAENAMKML